MSGLVVLGQHRNLNVDLSTTTWPLFISARMSSLPVALHAQVQRLMTSEAEAFAKICGKLAETTAATPKVVQIYRRIDTLQSSSRLHIDCKSGCSYCCHYHVYVTPLEVFAIVESVQRMPRERQMAIEKSLRAYCDQVKGWGAHKHIHTNIACVFLEAGSCSIYDVRPLACRRHHSADVGVCKRTFDDPTSPEQAPQDATRVTASRATEILFGMAHGHEQLDCDSYELHAALLEALTNKACFRRWKSGKAAFPSVADRASKQSPERVEQ